MNSSPQGPIQRPRGRRNPLLRSDFSGSGKTREQGAAEGREGAKSRVRPRPPLPKTRQHGAAPENAFTVAPESAQDVSTARSVPNNGGSGAAEPQAKKLILQGGLAPNCYPPQSTNCGRPTRSRSCCPSTGGRSRRLYRRCLPARWRIRCTRHRGHKLKFEAVARVSRDVDWCRIRVVGTSASISGKGASDRKRPTLRCSRMGTAPVLSAAEAKLSGHF